MNTAHALLFWGRARLAHLNLGAPQQRTTSTSPSNSDATQNTTNADNVPSADLGLIGLAVM